MESPSKLEAGAAKPPREVWRRWTPRLTAGGWTPVSDYFLENYRRVGLSTPEAMLVLQMMRHKWDEASPRPSFKTLAKRMGISDTAARGHARSLQAKGFLIRVNRVGRSNLFDLNPLFVALERLLDQDEAKKAQIMASIAAARAQETAALASTPAPASAANEEDD